jgi:hypothetical protein
MVCCKNQNHDYRKTAMSIKEPVAVTPEYSAGRDEYGYIEPDEAVSKGFWKMTYGFIAVILVIIGFATFKGTMAAFTYEALPDGSFPTYRGAWAGLPFVLAFLGFFSGTIMMYFSSKKHATFKVMTTLGLGILAIITSMAFLNNYGHDRWEKAITGWASQTYGVESAYVTESHYNGIVGYKGNRFEPAVYIDPPKDIKYLTTSEGKYVAELIPDHYRSGSVRLYAIATGKDKPELIAPK